MPPNPPREIEVHLPQFYLKSCEKHWYCCSNAAYSFLRGIHHGGVASLIVLINDNFALILSVSSHLFLLTFYTAHLHYIYFSFFFFFGGGALKLLLHTPLKLGSCAPASTQFVCAASVRKVRA